MQALDQQYWNNRYQQNETGWDIGYPSTPLKEYIDQLQNKDIAILIPGCGNSYEAEYLLEKGFSNITLIDIAPSLTKKLEEKFAKELDKRIRIVTGDFFEQQQQYDLILEQTFFCALDPSMREQYVQKMYELLKPGGKLVGVLFGRTFEGGPPFGGSREEYEPLFSKKFRIEILEACYNSIKPREGAELFMKMVKSVDREL
jgi:SAM-dependent methyltransferase